MHDHQLGTTHSPVCWSWGPRHYECALREIEVLRAEIDALRRVLTEMVSWFPSADTYRHLGFDPAGPMEALKAAKAALSKEQKT